MNGPQDGKEEKKIFIVKTVAYAFKEELINRALLNYSAFVTAWFISFKPNFSRLAKISTERESPLNLIELVDHWLQLHQSL